MKENKNMNWVSQSGLGAVDDMEIVSSLDLDPAVAYTKNINKAALDAARVKAYEGYFETGNNKEEAKLLADKDHKEAIEQIKNAEKLSGKKFL